MKRVAIPVGAFLLLLGAGSVSAQDTEAVPPVADPAAEQAPNAEQAPAVETDPAAETAAVETEAAHDWEFVLSATDKAPGASATVMVMEAEGGSDFVLVANGLPEIDALDEENRDVNAYTVWVVPGKDQVAESRMAGVLTVADGTGRLEASTDLETFGLIVTATEDGAPEKIGGVPVLTGIPVQATAPTEAVDAAAEAAEDVADEMAEDDADVAADVEEEIAEGVAEVEEETAEEALPDAQP